MTRAMTLEELAAATPRASPAPVPAWVLGCFERRAAMFADGVEDAADRVVRLQTHGLTGELRIPASRPDVSRRAGLHDCTVEELLAFACVDGGVADACWSNEALVRENGSGFQPYPVWPEPGRLHRIGPVMMEFAPSGAYVQDWRLQPGSSGLLVGLRLMFETGLDGLTRPRDGGLLIAGEHGLLALDRRRPLPSTAPAQQQMRAAGDPFAFADMAFDAEVAYTRRQPSGAYRVELSTNPFREGETLPITDGFHPTAITEILRQEIGEGDRRIVRQWRIDTLMADVEIEPRTAVQPDGEAWLRGLRADGP